MKRRLALALLTGLAALAASPEVHLLPAGEFKGGDGRPGPGKSWRLTDAAGQALAAKLNERHAGAVHFQFDYEHQVWMAEENGQPAPASAWATKFEWRPGSGLWATDVKWTAKAKQYIEADEYRYISPTIVYDKTTGDVLDVLNAALVARPNLDLSPVAQARLAQLSAEMFPDPSNLEPNPMNPVLKALLARLNLSEAATEAEATAAFDALKAKADKLVSAETEVATLKAASPDPAKWAPISKVTELNAELAALKGKEAERELDAVIAKAKAEGRIVPAAEQAFRDVGKADLAQLKKLLEATPPNPALAGNSQTNGQKPGGEGGKGAALTDAELATCKQLGVSPEAYAKARDEEQAAAAA